jgi:hypothetical protein
MYITAFSAVLSLAWAWCWLVKRGLFGGIDHYTITPGATKAEVVFCFMVWITDGVLMVFSMPIGVRLFSWLREGIDTFLEPKTEPRRRY